MSESLTIFQHNHYRTSLNREGKLYYGLFRLYVEYVNHRFFVK